MTLALVDRVRRLPRAARAELYAALQAIGPGALATRRYDAPGFWSRPDQIVTPAEREAGLIVFGGPRGSGKTWAAARYFTAEILAGRARQPRIVAAKESDLTVVINGPSGIRTWMPPAVRAATQWVSSSDEGPAGVLRFPNGVDVPLFSARDPESCVSWEGDLDLYDDVAKWGVNAEKAWKHARTSCRVGRGQGVVATTRRGTILIRKLLAGGNEDIVIKRPPSPRANAANLTPDHYAKLVAELRDVDGDFIAGELDDEDIAAASPFQGIDFTKAPVRIDSCPRSDLVEVVVAIDPSEGKGGDHDEWGIVAAGRRRDRHVVVLDDKSGSYDDMEACQIALALGEAWGVSKYIVERNRGPRVQAALLAAYYAREVEDRRERARPRPEIIGVTAREGKRLRCGPVRSLYKGGQMHHLPGLQKLEKQAREMDPDGPRRPRVDDRVDAAVHAAHHLADLGAAVGPDPLEAARAAFVGLREANASMPAPEWGWDRV